MMEKSSSIRIKLASLILSLCLAFGAEAQLFDTVGLSTWPTLTNSYETWMQGAFNAGRDTSDQADFGWGAYNLATHFIEGDSIYIIKTVQGNYKGVSIDQLASGVYTVTYSDLDGSNKTTKLLDRSSYGTKNFFYYALDTETIKDLEPWTEDWDILFTKYLIFFPGFGSYPVSGILNNRNVRVSQVEKDSGVSASINDTVQFPFSDDISTIGYDWKAAGPNGITIYDTLTFFVEDQMGNINELKLLGYAGSGTGAINFTVNGLADSIVMGAGNADQVYYSTQSLGAVQTNQDQAWDLALYAQSGFAAIPIRINDVAGVELYRYPNADISHWNTAGIDENDINLVSVYPNPASDFINIAIQSELTKDVAIQLININGQLEASYTRSVQAGMKEIQISSQNLTPGVYILQLKTENYTASTRLVIQP